MKNFYLNVNDQFSINKMNYKVHTKNGISRFTCKPVNHKMLPQLDDKFMVNSIEYIVCYINHDKNRFSCKIYINPEL